MGKTKEMIGVEEADSLSKKILSKHRDIFVKLGKEEP